MSLLKMVFNFNLIIIITSYINSIYINIHGMYRYSFFYRYRYLVNQLIFYRSKQYINKVHNNNIKSEYIML